MTYEEYRRAFAAAAGGRAEVFAEVQEAGRSVPLLRLRTPGDRRLVVTAGFHGEEPGGPLTLLAHLGELLERAERLGVGLTVFPLINPTGFEQGTRYNASGEQPNNDFLRYEVAPGVWKGELQEGEGHLRWTLAEPAAKETRAVLRALEEEPTPAAALDLHQDAHLPRPAAYAYVFGPRGRWLALVRETVQHVRLATRWGVAEDLRTDTRGLVWSHDGSVTDYFHRRGVPYTAALETTTVTPREVCHRVHLTWLHGFLELAARATVTPG